MGQNACSCVGSTPRSCLYLPSRGSAVDTRWMCVWMPSGFTCCASWMTDVPALDASFCTVTSPSENALSTSRESESDSSDEMSRCLPFLQRSYTRLRSIFMDAANCCRNMTLRTPADICTAL